MLVKVKQIFTGKIVEQDLPITEAQIDAWKNGTLIQNAFPHLSPDQREFLQTGMSPEEWDEATLISE